MSIIIPILPLLLLISALAYDTPTQCTPFGIRLALGQNYWIKQSNETVSIRFNTRLNCQRSYITIQQQSSIKKIYCSSSLLKFSNYTSYIHSCSIDLIKKGSYYQYMVYGWSGTDTPIPYRNVNMISYLINENENNVKMLTIGDWGYLQQKSKIYNRLDQSLNGILSLPLSQQPNLIYLVGDYAYDLSTNNGKNYQNFLIMLSQISIIYPCIFMTGNHQYNTIEDYKIFTQSFQLYNLTLTNLTVINIGSFYLLMFDPYSIVFNQKYNKTDLISRFYQTLSELVMRGKPIIVTSHYPLACSGSSIHCQNQHIILKEFFHFMIQFHVLFYIGAHYHTYQRLYPYYQNMTYDLIKGPYKINTNTPYLISVVEGIAGNDKSIVQSYGKLDNYTAALSYNVTGYGIMKGGQGVLEYRHYKSTDWKNQVDFVQINYAQLMTTISTDKLMLRNQ